MDQLTGFTLQLHLHPGQMRVFGSKKRFIIVTAGRRWGKTVLAAYRAIVKALDEANVKRKPVFIIAPIATQAKLLYWQLLLDKLGGVGGPFIVNALSNEGHIFLKNGVLIGVKGSDRPDTLRGIGLYHVELDEYADMKPETWESIIRPALADVSGTACFIGTPKGRNHFYDLVQFAVANPDTWDYFHFPSSSNPFLPPEEIELAKNTLSSAVFRQEFLASFETGGSDSFKEEWFRYDDEEPWRLDAQGKKEAIPGDWYVVVDLAGFAEVQKATGYRQKRLDYTAIAVVKILEDERWYVRDIYLGRWGVQETAKRIVDAVESCQTLNLGIEKGALFNAVAPYLQHEAATRKPAVFLSVEPLSHENRTKTDRIGWALQGRMEHKKVIFRNGPHMREVKDQFLNFPSTLVHDDALDCLAFVPQLAAARVFHTFAEAGEDYWEPTDELVGI